MITIKNDKLEKSALSSRKLNDSCIKRRPHKPNMEELLNQISVKSPETERSNYSFQKDTQDKLNYPKSRVDRAYLKLQEQNLADIIGLKRVLRTCRYTNNISRKTDRTLDYSNPASLDDILVETRGSKQQNEGKSFEVLSKLEPAGYPVSKNI